MCNFFFFEFIIVVMDMILTKMKRRNRSRSIRVNRKSVSIFERWRFLSPAAGNFVNANGFRRGNDVYVYVCVRSRPNCNYDDLNTTSARCSCRRVETL